MVLLKKSLVLLTTVFILSSVTACNTMHGFGRDVERGGQNIKQTADDAKHHPHYDHRHCPRGCR